MCKNFEISYYRCFFFFTRSDHEMGLNTENWLGKTCIVIISKTDIFLFKTKKTDIFHQLFCPYLILHCMRTSSIFRLIRLVQRSVVNGDSLSAVTNACIKCIVRRKLNPQRKLWWSEVLLNGN